MMDPIIEKYVDEIIEEAALTSLPADFKIQFREKIGEEVQRRIGILTMKELSEKDFKEFDEKIAKKDDVDPNEIALFFREKIPNYELFLAGKLSEFKNEFLEQVKNVGKQ